MKRNRGEKRWREKVQGGRRAETWKIREREEVRESEKEKGKERETCERERGIECGREKELWDLWNSRNLEEERVGGGWTDSEEGRWKLNGRNCRGEERVGERGKKERVWTWERTTGEFLLEKVKGRRWIEIMSEIWRKYEEIWRKSEEIWKDYEEISSLIYGPWDLEKFQAF
mgnify:CR=1 FL=1